MIGAGGTGAYEIDFLAKTPVREIRVFDADAYHVNNAFRSPGRLVDSELGQAKTHVIVERNANFRRGMTACRQYVETDLTTELEGVTFAFVCVDRLALGFLMR